MRSIKFESLMARPETLRPRPTRELVAQAPSPPASPPATTLGPAPQPPAK